MFTIPDSLKEYFNSGAPQYLYIVFPDIIDETNTRQADAPLIITHEEIKQGSFVVDNKCTAGTWFSPGDAVASECSFTILNSGGRYDDYDFSGQKFIVFLGTKNDTTKTYLYFRNADEAKELISDMDEYTSRRRLCYIGPSGGVWLYDYNLNASIEIEIGDSVMAQAVGMNYHTFDKEEPTRIPLGVFYADTNNRSYGKKEIALSGLDDLGRLDIPFPFSSFNYNYEKITLSTLARTLTAQTFYDGINEGKEEVQKYIPYFENTLYSVLSEKGLLQISTIISKQTCTVRQLLSKLAQLCGTIITVTRQGKIRFMSYSDVVQNSLVLSPSTRQGFSLNSQKVIPFIGTQYTTNGKTWFIDAQSGSTYQDYLADRGVAFDYTANDLFMNFTGSTDRRTVMESINDTYKSISMMPFKGYSSPAPYLDLLDEIIITDADGNTLYTTRVTHIQHKFNAWSLLETAGQDISSGSKNSALNGTTAKAQAATKNIVQLRELVPLYNDDNGLSVREVSEKIENLSLYSVFLVTIKRASDNAPVSILCTKGYYNTKEGETPQRDTIRGNFTWRSGNTAWEYYIRCTDNFDDTWTVNSIDYYAVSSGSATKADDTCTIIDISAIS